MFENARRLFERVGPYGMAAAVQAGSSFIVLPLLLLLIGATAYGRYALLEPLVAMLAQLLLLGSHQGLLHAICKENEPPWRELKRTLFYGQTYMLPLGLGIGALVAYWQQDATIGMLFGLALYLEAVNLACFTTVRAIGDAWYFLAATAIRSFTTLAGIFLATLTVGRDVLDERFALALVCIGTSLSLVLLCVRIARYQVGADTSPSEVTPWQMVSKSIGYGFPLVLAGLCQSTIALADRFVLSWFVSPASLTGYVVAVKLANALNLAATPINLWWPTARFKHLKDVDGGQAFFRNATVKIGGIYVVMACLLILATPYLLPLLGPGVKAESGIAALLILAAFFQAFQVVLNVGLLSAGHTSKTFYIAATLAVLHTAGCVILVRPYGAYGVAAMSAITGAIFCLAVNVFSQRILRIPQNVKVISIELACLVVAVFSMTAWDKLQ